MRAFSDVLIVAAVQVFGQCWRLKVVLLILIGHALAFLLDWAPFFWPGPMVGMILSDTKSDGRWLAKTLT